MENLFGLCSRFYQDARKGRLPPALSQAILHSNDRMLLLDPRKIPECCEEYRVAGAPLGIPKGFAMADNAGRFIIPSDTRFVTAWHREDWIIDWLSRSLHVVTIPFDHTFIAVAYAADDCRGSPKVVPDKLHKEEDGKLKALFYGKQAEAVMMIPMRFTISEFWVPHKAEDAGIRRRLAIDVQDEVRGTGFPDCSTIFYIDHEAMGVMVHYADDVRLGGPWWPGERSKRGGRWWPGRA